MDSFENDEFEEDFFIKKQDKQKVKEEILDENFKKASISVNKTKTEEKLKPKKKPFLKLGLFLIVIGIICLLIMNVVPWAYAKYDNKTSGFKDNEIFYYTDSTIDNLGNDTNFSSFFESTDSYKYLSVRSDDLTSFTRVQTYILIAIIVIGVIFTIFSILLKRSDFPLEKYKLFHCIFAFITAILCIYFIFITIKFMGANMLVFYNANFVSSNIENLSLIFIAPIVLLFIVSGILKMTTTILKINFNDFEKILDEKTTNKYLTSLKYGVKIK
jgi:hypothetical protein